MRTLPPNLRGSKLMLSSLLNSIIAIELLKPSNQLFINTPKIDDTLIFSNKLGEFSALLPEMSFEVISLFQILGIFSQKGTKINIKHSNEINENLKRRIGGSNIILKFTQDIFPSGWIGERYFVSGSIKFFSDKVDFGENEILFSSDKDELSKMLINARNSW